MLGPNTCNPRRHRGGPQQVPPRWQAPAPAQPPNCTHPFPGLIRLVGCHTAEDTKPPGSSEDPSAATTSLLYASPERFTKRCTRMDICRTPTSCPGLRQPHVHTRTLNEPAFRTPDQHVLTCAQPTADTHAHTTLQVKLPLPGGLPQNELCCTARHALAVQGSSVAGHATTTAAAAANPKAQVHVRTDGQQTTTAPHSCACPLLVYKRRCH